MQNDISISLAQTDETQTVIDFFEYNINTKSDQIYNPEFLCPYGVTGAINRKQIIIAKQNNQIIGALRFYKQKRKNILQNMLTILDCPIIKSRCHKNTKFNNYYKKTGRILEKTDNLGNLRYLKQ